MNAPVRFAPGSLITARQRDWVVLPGSSDELLQLRPLASAEDDATLIYLPLERDPVGPASFPWPNPEQHATHTASRLMRDALQLKLRSGAGPFRSFGNIAVEPRAYQLVPLLMALRQETVRLLIADDVGVGKTIEASLIVRELYDRGEIRRLTVLCPPHLCEQWQTELANRFHLHAEIISTRTAARLERGLPAGQSVFDAYPFTVVSLDYIKQNTRRDEFQRACPEFVIVDEAHTCTQNGVQSRQLRYQLLKGLAADSARHMLLLTATPHSGDEEAFYNLLGLLKPEFAELKDLPLDARKPLREELAKHFVQRRRHPDIAEWQDSSQFPERKTADIPYRLTGPWGQLFNDVLDYARELVQRAEGQSHRQQRMNWWAALALLRCISSSPAAAINALNTRLSGGHLLADTKDNAELENEALERILDGTADALSASDLEPVFTLDDGKRLTELVHAAEQLTGSKRDPKLAALIEHLSTLIKEGFAPVVFCRYIATAHYVAEQLKTAFPKHLIRAITGEMNPQEREAAIESMGEVELRILVATDCLSEGINLQALFNAVIHYDLSWNPTRHEQREGRVDRFGQRSPEVRASTLYGLDNPVDGAVLQVILRKAESIRKELGVLVPMPDDDNKLTEALLGAVLLKKGAFSTMQQPLDFGEPADAIETAWQSAKEKAKRNQTLFSQRRIKPEDVLPEWEKTVSLIGGEADVERFVSQSLARLGAPLEPIRQHFKAPLDALKVPHPGLHARLEVEGFTGTRRIAFSPRTPAGVTFIHRTHPLVSLLADYLLEVALDSDNAAPDFVARTGAIFTQAVTTRTAIALLRLRHQLTVRKGDEERMLLCEESVPITLTAGGLLVDTDARPLLDADAAANMPDPLKVRHIRDMLETLRAMPEALDKLAAERAEALLADHRRVRDAAQDRGSYNVRPSLPVDVIGLYVLVPKA